MKTLVYIFLSILLVNACNKDENSDLNYKQEMREFVIGISNYAKESSSDFLIIPQNGIELITTKGEEDRSLSTSYLDAIDGHGQEDLFYGYNNDNEATPSNENSYLQSFLGISKSAGNVILVTDYCSTSSKMTDSYNKNNEAGYVSFAANHRELNNIPDYPNPIYNETENEVTNLMGVSNFLYLINPENFASKSSFIESIISTNYDLLIMDLFFNDGVEFTVSEIDSLKNKANGGKRLVIAYMSIGEAEDYRYYWQTNWNSDKPIWLDEENPDWEGNFKVKYWEKEWQDIIFGNDNSYLTKIVTGGFDGVYLDIIDAFEYFE